MGGWALAAQVALLALESIPGPRHSFTGPAFNDAGVTVLACIAQNIGTVPVRVEGELRGPDGGAIDSGQVMVPPGQRVEIAGALNVASGYCAFTFDAEAATLRGYLHVRTQAGETRALFPHFVVRGESGTSVVETVTPPLRRAGADLLGCIVQNLNDAPVMVDVELVDADGTVADSITTEAMPGHFASVLNSNGAHLGAYCRFSFTEAIEEIRGYATLFGPAAGDLHLVFPATSPDAPDSVIASTPPVSSVAGDATSCIVQNLHDLAVMVEAELVDADGTVLDDGSDIVPPGDVETVAGHTEAGTNTFCRFTFANTEQPVHAFITRHAMGPADTDLLARAEAVTAAPVQPTALYSPPVGVGGDGLLRCTAVNASPADATVRMAIDDGSGAIIAMADVVVPAGGAASAGAVQNQTQAFCTLTFDANPAAIRGFATRTNDTGSRTELVFTAAEPGPPPPATPTASATITATSTRPPTTTPSPSATATATPTATMSRTASAAPSDTPDRTATSTAGPVPPCAGDCDGNGAVSIAELITLVNGALGAGVSCEAGDVNRDGTITIDELVTAVGNALNGCP